MGASDRVQVFDLASGKIAWDLSNSRVDDRIDVLRPASSFSADERYIASVNRDKSISVFDLSSGAEISNVIDEDIYSVQFGVDPPRNSSIGLGQATTRSSRLNLFQSAKIMCFSNSHNSYRNAEPGFWLLL